MLTCSFAAKTLKHKNNLVSYAGSEIFSLQNLFFFSLPTCLWKILFSGEIPWIIFLMQFHTHHSLDFIRKQKMFKITGYIHLYYKIPFLSGVARILVTFSFFLFIIHREFCFNIFSVWYKAATHVSWEVEWFFMTSHCDFFFFMKNRVKKT